MSCRRADFVPAPTKRTDERPQDGDLRLRVDPRAKPSRNPGHVLRTHEHENGLNVGMRGR